MRALVAYLSYSGNTKEVADIIVDQLTEEGINAQLHHIGYDLPVDVATYDYIFLGTFTWDYGATPDEVKEFVLDIGYKPDNIAVFGTGDTQFGGEEQYCQAVDKLVKFYNSPWEGLKIEQSPRGSQELLVKRWLGGVIQHVKYVT